MSNALAISGVSAVLQFYLGNMYSNLSAQFGGTIGLSAQAPDLVQARFSSPTATENQVNLFLHQVTYNAAWRNVQLPSLDADGKTLLTSPPLALDLHYLLTVYGTADWQAEGLLGYALMSDAFYNAIQHQHVGLAVEASVLLGPLNVMPPEPDGRFVRNQLTTAGVLQKNPAQLGIRRQVAEHLAARKMIKVRNVAQNPSLRPFAGTRRAEQKYRAEFHGFHGQGRERVRDCPCAEFALRLFPQTGSFLPRLRHY